jgi:(4S)-4-hydroxy-5-phosphonooxypentane-2,3-dione isomerase
MYLSALTTKIGETPMSILKSISITAAAVALSAGAWFFVPTSSHQAAAQSGPHYVNLVELDIVPTEFDKFIEAIKENGAASVKTEPGCLEFNIIVSDKDPHHVLLFEVYQNAAALDAHRATDHFKKYQATVVNMVAKREVRAFSSVALNGK